MTQYFVSYYWQSLKQSGHGSINISLLDPIKGYSDISLIKDWLDENIKDNYGGSSTCIILNWKRYEESTPVAKGDQAQRLLEAVTKWKQLYQPTCGESIYQTDKVNESCPELVEELMNIIGWESE